MELILNLALTFLLMIFVYFSIHVARGLSILALQPCLNKSGSIRCCKGKYATYDFDNSHSIVMWWEVYEERLGWHSA